MLAGGGFGVAGATQFASSSRFVSLTRWSGRLGVAGTVLAEGFVVLQYKSGELTERQFWRGQAEFGGGLAGGAAGAWAGAKVGAAVGAGIGSFVAPGPGTAFGAILGGKIGAFGGGMGGGFAGAHFAAGGVDGACRLNDAAQQESHAQFLLKHYQAR